LLYFIIQSTGAPLLLWSIICVLRFVIGASTSMLQFDVSTPTSVLHFGMGMLVLLFRYGKTDAPILGMGTPMLLCPWSIDAF